MCSSLCSLIPWSETQPCFCWSHWQRNATSPSCIHSRYRSVASARSPGVYSAFFLPGRWLPFLLFLIFSHTAWKTLYSPRTIWVYLLYRNYACTELPQRNRATLCITLSTPDDLQQTFTEVTKTALCIFVSVHVLKVFYEQINGME